MAIFTTVLWSLTLVSFAAGAAYITETPSDTVAKVGDNVTLICETVIPDHEQDNLMWEYQTPEGGSPIFNSIADDVVNKPEKYEIHGEYNLRVKTAALEDAGMYTCRLTLSQNSPNSADLIIVEQPEIIMTDMKVGRNVSVLCKTRFGSRRLEDMEEVQIPHMRLKLDGKLVENGQESVAPDTRTTYAASVLTYQVNATALEEYDNKNLSCEVWTAEPSFLISTSMQTSVKYSVKNIRVNPMKDIYEVGEVIYCLADGNPTPEIRWAPRKSNSKTTWAGANLTVAEDMIGTEQTWECTATNTVDTVAAESLIITFGAVEPKDPSAGGAEKMGASLATAMLLFAITYMFH